MSQARGLVFGGSLRQGSFKVGDLVELRPGLFAGGHGKFTIHPVQSSVVSIQSGDGKGMMPLQRARQGGLVAVQTSVCPSLASDNFFDASMIGKPDALPPVWQELELECSLVGAESVATKGQCLRLTSGSAQAEASVLIVNGNRLKVSLTHKPLCAMRGAILAIECCENKHWVLCASGKLVGGTPCCEGVHAEQAPLPAALAYTQRNDAFEHFVSDFRSSIVVAEGSSEFSINEGTIEMHPQEPEWHNFVSVMLNLDRDPNTFIQFLKQECDLDSSLAGDKKTLRIHCKKHRKQGLKDRLRLELGKFVTRFVQCKQCKSLSTTLIGGRSTQRKLECRSCKAGFFVGCSDEAESLNIQHSHVNGSECRWKMPALQIQIQGSGKMIQTVFLNLKDVSEAFHRNALGDADGAVLKTTPEILLRNFSFVLNTSMVADNSVGGTHEASKVQEALQQYIDDFVCCPNSRCRLPEVVWQFDSSDQLHGHCKACSWQGALAPTRNHSQKLAAHLSKARKK